MSLAKRKQEDEGILVLDAGNSRLTMAGCRPSLHLPGVGGQGAADWQALPPLDGVRHLDNPPPGASAHASFLAEVAAFSGDPAFKSRVLVSVVPALTVALAGVLPDVEILDHTWPTPFVWGVSDPAAVGPDRIANVALAAACGLRDALVVDAGTATTFDLLAGGVFRGGMIAPGMAFAARKIGEAAARLDPAPFGPCPLEVGVDTARALAAGSWHAGRFGILGTIDGLLEVYGERPVILTGGLARFLQRPGWVHDPWWTLRGAAWMAVSRKPAP
ncbi:type III pantothenate kinase [bacterium]|nr:type III pantothenate kinase [bacterium]